MTTFSVAAMDGSSSTVTTEAVTGWHVLNISKYSQTKGHYGIGRSFTSTTFTVGGHRWCIAYYADGYDDDDDDSDSDCICFDLVLKNPKPNAAPVKADFVFTLLDGNGEPVPEYTKSWNFAAFSSDVPSWGFQRFIERDELEVSPSYLVGDGFSVRCDVTVYKEVSKAQVAAAASLIQDEPEIAAVAPPPPAARRGVFSVWRLILMFLVVLFAASWLEFMC